MKIIDKLSKVWRGIDYAFLIHKSEELRFSEIVNQNPADLSEIKIGDVVAIIGDFNPTSVLTLLRLIDIGAIIVPLTVETRCEHEYFFESAQVDVVIEGNQIRRLSSDKKHELIEKLRQLGHAGLILFSTGTTGRPKAILHDLTLFLRRFDTPRPTLRTINFLLFDHIGGINTLLHTLFNKGVVVAPESRTVDSILAVCQKYDVEVLPTTPTFLRMMLMSGAVPDKIPESLKVITYGTERMDQPTLNELCEALPNIDFRQTFGMSELGIVRVKSKARDSLYMKVGGEGVETKVVDQILHIRSSTRMLGYLNADSPFDSDGWYNTKDVVEQKGGFYKVVGRIGDVINVGGLKFMASEVERVALEFPNVELVKAYSAKNPITGQHLEIIVQPNEVEKFDKIAFVAFLKSKLLSHMTPKRVRIEKIAVGHRFKKA
jgi:acyl-CoA synthetase (AMP-forming)/AMP-acid ligase II